ncbi:MAG: DNA mismatch repair endonuclease MutL [Oscillospiraceae bacterium]|nr:DNA mismatch repair endonuclease MutL [Oscillospiraceae bacterium]
MPKIIQLSPHIANLIAAGEVVERPASVVKELLENAVDAGASKVTVEIRNGGMTFLRVTDNGCGMSAEDAKTAFLRHATSKLRTADDLAAISTMGFRGEALAAIASVSRIDLLTKTAGAITGVSLALEAGNVTDESDAGCPDGTTIIIRDLFYNTPARMKFMKSDSVEGGKVAAAVQMQALAHPEVAFTFIRDGKPTLQTPGDGNLKSAVYCVYGRESARFAEVSSRWEGYSLKGFVSRPTDSRPSRSLQTFFVNNRPVKSKLLVSALEEAYRNQIMVGKFPACVLHLTLPANAVDVNVHPAKTEVKFLSEKNAFDCVHYGVLGALNSTPDRPDVKLKPPVPVIREEPKPRLAPRQEPAREIPKKKDDYFRTMTTEEFKTFSAVLAEAPKPDPEAARRTLSCVNSERPAPQSVRNIPLYPVPEVPPVPKIPVPAPPIPEPEPVQQELTMPKEIPWRMVGELYRSYILVEQGDNAFLIDKHAAHERILFERLRANPRDIVSQDLLIPATVRLRPDAAAMLLSKTSLLDELGFGIEEFGENTILVRRAPMDIGEGEIPDALMEMADDLLSGRTADTETLRDELLHTMACKAAIKAGWKNDDRELLAVVKEVMSREELKYCPHGRPICITLSKKTLEKQFKRT